MQIQPNDLFIDFETRSACDLKKCGADVYAKDPTTDVLCVGYALENEPAEVISGAPPLADIFESKRIISHNAAFEIAIWNNVCVRKYNWPPVRPEQFICTMAMAYAMALPGSLEKASAAVGIDKQKDMVGHRIMMQLSQPRSLDPLVWWDDSEKSKKLYEYCKQDVEVERELFKRLVGLSQKELELWALDQKINTRGVSIDVKAVKKAIEIVEFEKVRLDKAMRQITNNAVATCTATKQLTDWIKLQGVDVESVAKAEVIELLENENLPLTVRKALELRQEAAKSSTAKLTSMLNCVGSDGRVRGMFQYHGAGTGRWAGRRLQLHNLPRSKISQSDIDGVFELLK